MDFDQSDVNGLTRRATDLSAETADVARLLRVRLGADHQLTRSANEMIGSLEAFVRELRSFSASADRVEISEHT